MHLINERIIKIPGITEDEELNLRLMNYVERTAIPTLEDNIIGPFTAPLKEMAIELAAAENGADADGILNKAKTSDFFVRATKETSSTSKETDNAYKISVKAYAIHRPHYEKILSKTRDFVKAAIEDNKNGKRRAGVRKVRDKTVGDKTYLSAECILKQMEWLESTHFSAFNRADIAGIFLGEEKTENPPILPGAEMLVPLESRFQAEPHLPSRFQGLESLTEGRVNDYLDAKAFKSGLERFLTSFEKISLDKYGITEEELAKHPDKKQSYEFCLSDGSSASYLFYLKTSPEHSEVYNRLAARPKSEEGKEIVIKKDAGDLFIITALAFKEQYEKMHGKSGLIVSTHKKRENSRKGQLIVSRTSKSGEHETTEYDVYKSVNYRKDKSINYREAIDGINESTSVNENKSNTSIKENMPAKLFVSAQSFLKAMDRAALSVYDPKPKVKIDFYPEMPEGYKNSR